MWGTGGHVFSPNTRACPCLSVGCLPWVDRTSTTTSRPPCRRCPPPAPFCRISRSSLLTVQPTQPNRCRTLSVPPWVSVGSTWAGGPIGCQIRPAHPAQGRLLQGSTIFMASQCPDRCPLQVPVSAGARCAAQPYTMMSGLTVMLEVSEHRLHSSHMCLKYSAASSITGSIPAPFSLLGPSYCFTAWSSYCGSFWTLLSFISLSFAHLVPAPLSSPVRDPPPGPCSVCSSAALRPCHGWPGSTLCGGPAHGFHRWGAGPCCQANTATGACTCARPH